MVNPILAILRDLVGYTPFETERQDIPGIGTGVAYVTGDAFGIGFWVTGLPKKGIIDSVTFIDLDNEGIAKTILLFRAEVSISADNAAFAPTRNDLATALQINLTTGDYVTFSLNRMATVTSIGLPFIAPEGRLWCRLVTRGADNIATDATPQISFGGRQQ